MIDNIFILRLFKNPFLYGGITLIIIFSICLHEFMHAWVALRQGDDTAARAGHLTLNPLKQMGPFSLVMLAFIGVAWGQVPVNPAKFKHKYSNLLVSFAGPATNLALWLFFGILYMATAMRALRVDSETIKMVADIFFSGAVLNLVLAIFNSLPIPGLDGGSVITNSKLRYKIADSEAAKGMFLILFLLIFLGFGHIFAGANFVTTHFLNLLMRMLF